jgi:hypothetical protein
MIKRVLFSVVILSTVYGCIPLKTPSHVRQTVGGYDGAKTTITDLININGYFVHAEPKNTKNDSSYTYFMFFEDGMVNMRVHDYDAFPNPNKEENISQYIHQVITESDGKQAKSFYNSLGWGRYIITDDTIKSYYHSGWGYPDCYAFEIWFKVLDRNHISDIYFARIMESTLQMTDIQKKENVYENAIPSSFVPLEGIPPTNSWIKGEKWFWSNEENWKDYMESLEKDKK